MASRLCPACFGAHIALDAACCAGCAATKAARAAWREPTAAEKRRVGQRQVRLRDLVLPPTEAERVAIDAALKGERR